MTMIYAMMSVTSRGTLPDPTSSGDFDNCSGNAACCMQSSSPRLQVSALLELGWGLLYLIQVPCSLKSYLYDFVKSVACTLIESRENYVAEHQVNNVVLLIVKINCSSELYSLVVLLLSFGADIQLLHTEADDRSIEQ